MTIRLRSEPEQLKLDFINDGARFPASPLGGDMPRSLSERVKLAGGALELTRAVIPGTAIDVLFADFTLTGGGVRAEPFRWRIQDVGSWRIFSARNRATAAAGASPPAIASPIAAKTAPASASGTGTRAAITTLAPADRNARGSPQYSSP